jgi:hypothetical protein
MSLSRLTSRPGILAAACLVAIVTSWGESAQAQMPAPATAAATPAPGTPPTPTTGDSPAPAPTATAPVFPPDTLLIHNATAAVLQRDYDTALLRIPEKIRGGFGVDPTRINTLLQSLLVDKTLAAQARKDGIDQDPQVQARVQAEVDKILTGIVIERETAQWRKLFNALPNIDATAREEWLAHADKYTGAPQYQLTVVLFGTPQHTPDEARRMADEARKQILAGADMAKIAREQSDDTLTKANGGKVDWTTPGELGPAVATAVARLTKEGDISNPIRSAAGFQIVRLDAKKPGKLTPFEEAKPQILDQLRTAYVDGMLSDQLHGIKTDPTIVVNQPAVDALVVHYDPEQVRQLTLDSARTANEKRRGGGKKTPVQLGTPPAADDVTAPADTPDPGK